MSKTFYDLCVYLKYNKEFLLVVETATSLEQLYQVSGTNYFLLDLII